MKDIHFNLPDLSACQGRRMGARLSATCYHIKEMTEKTGVKAGTIRFYEKCGFLEPVERMPNGYRVFNEHHIYQIRVCSLVFGGFVNKRLRKISMDVIAAARAWDLEAYDRATQNYLSAIEQDILRTKKAVSLVTKQIDQDENDEREYSKKEAAELLSVTPETIRNWERNGLLAQKPAYSRRLYGQAEIRRMYMIRFLLDVGYSCMAILRFLTEYDAGRNQEASNFLLGTVEDRELKSRTDRYLKSLMRARAQADSLCCVLGDMRKF